MRDFFKKEVLDRTYEIFGVRQTDEEKMSDDDIKFLLDGLCQVSKNRSYIPEEDQKNIIRGCMLTDKTYRNINLRLIDGWLEANGRKFFTEAAHVPTPPTKPPVEGEERERWLEIWRKTLQQVEETYPSQRVKGNGERMREEFDRIAPIPPSTETSALEEACGITEEMKKETLEDTQEKHKT